jgi:hypothetical protein
MTYNRDRAIGCVIEYNSVIKAVKFIDSYGTIPPNASDHLRRALKAVYGRQVYNYLLHHRPKLRLVRSR